MHSALYRKFRPKTFEDVIAQSHITQTLKNQVSNSRISHAYIFTGIRGTGKTSCAKIFSRAVNCEGAISGNPCNTCASCVGILDGSILDVSEIDAASNNGVDNIRDIRDESNFTPVHVKKRVYIIDEVHMLSGGAFNALLKTLEEPPEHVVFILATTEINKVPATILSRCQRFDFKRINYKDISEKIRELCSLEGVTITDEACDLIARLADGSMRDSLSLLERCIADKSVVVDNDLILKNIGLTSPDHIVSILQDIMDSNISSAILKVEGIYSEGRDIHSILEEIMNILRDVAVLKIFAARPADGLLSTYINANVLSRIADKCELNAITILIDIISESIIRLSRGINGRIELEVCLLRIYGILNADSPAVPQHNTRKDIANYESVQIPLESQPIAVASVVKEPPAALAETQDFSIFWDKVLERLKDTLKRTVYTSLLHSAKVSCNGSAIDISAENSVSFDVLKKQEVKIAIRQCILDISGREYSVNVKNIDANDEHTSLDRVIDRAKKYGIEVSGI